MKKSFIQFLFLSAFILTTLFISCKPTTIAVIPEDTNSENANPENTEPQNPVAGPSANEYFWGNWVRMDSGIEYEVLETKVVQGQKSFDITSSSENTLNVKNLGTFTKESDSVMVCNNIPYFRKGGTNLEYTLKLVGFTSVSRAAGSPMTGLKAKGKSAKYKNYESNGESDSEGTIKLTAPTVNDTQTVQISTGTETLIIPGLQINNSGDYMGTVALVGKDDYNLKITGTISDDQKDDGYLYGNNAKTYNMVLTITNISENNCSTSVCSIGSYDSNLDISSATNLTGFTISTLAGGATKTINLSLSYGQITAPYVDTGINVTIKNPFTDQEWKDYIPLRFFKGLIPITIAAKNPENNNNAALNGFVIYPDGNNQFFAIPNNDSSAIFVPTFGNNKPYMLVFSGATVTSELSDSTEMYYTVEPASITPKNVITEGNPDEIIPYITFGGDNHSETNAFAVTQGFEAYLREGEIDYYSIKADSSTFYNPEGSIFYSVKYESEKGDTPGTKIIKKGSKLTSTYLPNLQCEGYNFLGWYADDKKINIDSYSVNENITLTAKWKIISCLVNFNSMGGTSVSGKTVDYGQKVSRPLDPTKTSTVTDNYYFAGWYTSTDGGNTLSNTPFDFDNPIKSNITLYAKWTTNPVKYTVTFNSSGGTSVESQVLTYSQKATKPENPTKTSIVSESYSFVNWYTSSDGGQTLSTNPFDFNSAITSDITLYAKWSATTLTYTVSFNSMGGTSVSSQTVTGGQKVSSPVNPTKTAIVSESYTFAGWYTSTDEGNSLSTNPFDFNNAITSDITLYAKWSVTPVTYTVSFNSMGGSVVESQTVIGGQKAVRPIDPTKTSTVSENYAVTGWYTSADEGNTLSENPYNFDTPITSNITLYAKWTATPITYTVSFNSRGGTTVASQSITGGQKVTKPADPQKTDTTYGNYGFIDWCTSSDDGNTLSINSFDFNTPITSNITLYAKWDFDLPLTIEFIKYGTISIKNPWSTLKYSKNDGDLQSFSGEITVSAGDKISLYAKESENTSSTQMNIKCYADCYIYGNIMSLVTLQDQTDNWDPYASSVSEHAFRNLFSYNSYIKNHIKNNLYLPATTLASYCYYYMFYGCTGITEAPSLPATTLAGYCYCYMFYGCTGITEAPSLPATTLAGYCYSYMFSHCTSLTEAPSLPATTLASNCYYYMFKGCTSLTEAPSLPATTLTSSCYYYMFSGCTSLTETPSLPATTLASYCYYYMFSGCTSLTEAPSLPATTLASSCYEAMFSGCTGLTEAPSLPATKLASSCYYYMFSGCTSLTEAPSLPATKLAIGCYYSMFSGCTSLTEAPSLPATTLASNCYSYMFSGCTGITEAPSLPATTLASSCYWNMFSGCTGITEAPSLPATTLASSCYSDMFSGCTSLTEAPSLPAKTLASSCYSYMFKGCKSITEAPLLPATTLRLNCYSFMFSDCSSLNKIECLAQDISATKSTTDWLSGVSATGTFTKAKDMTDWTSGVNGIPEGWTIVEASE